MQAEFDAAATSRLVLARLAGATLTAITTAYWLGPLFPMTWLCALVAYEVWLSPMALRRVESETFGGGPRLRQLARVGLVLAGSALYLTPYVTTWLFARQAFAPVAALYIGCLLVHAAMFRAASRTLAIGALGLPVVVAVVMPFLTGKDPVASTLTALAACQLLVVVVMSIRDKQELIEKSVRYRTDAIDSDRANLAKSQFLATMSHELRTPLNAIIGYAEIMEDDLGANRMPERSDAQRIALAGHALLSLINDVLDLSKIEAGRLEVTLAPACVSTVVRGAVETCAQLANANGNRLTYALDPTIEHVSTDAMRLRQCLLNLVSNACKFTHNGEVHVSTLRVESELQIQVSDTGIGISGEQIARLFQPFVQADSSTTRIYGGTGLGLAITKRLCVLLGGKVSVTSVVGRGTVFTIQIPAEAGDVELAHAA